MSVGRAGLLAVAVAVSSCAYFNGLYNANRLVSDAESAAADGRTGEARSLWQQAAVKAESVAVRYPDSKHRDDALLLMGEALSQIDACPRAIPPLRAAADESPDPDVAQRALFALGRCLVRVGAPDSAVDVLDRVVSGDGPFADEARRWRGRAYRAMSQYSLAIVDLRGAPADGFEFDLALAFLGLDSLDAVHRVLEAQWAAPYDEQGWAAVVGALEIRSGREQLVDRLARRPDVTSGQRSRLLLADARRLATEGDSGSAGARFAAAASAAPDSVSGIAARAEAALLEFRASEHAGRLRVLADEIERAGQAGVALEWPARRFAEVLVATSNAIEDTALSHADLRLFRLAELMRDSLGARPFAGALFRHVYERYPGSPLAPKALLAELDVRGVSPQETLALLEERYSDSPYARALRGQQSADFLTLEDSLRTLLRRFPVTGQ